MRTSTRDIKAPCFVIGLGEGFRAAVRNRSPPLLLVSPLSVCFLSNSGGLVIFWLFFCFIFLISFHLKQPSLFSITQWSTCLPERLWRALFLLSTSCILNRSAFQALTQPCAICMCLCVDFCEWHSSVEYRAHSRWNINDGALYHSVHIVQSVARTNHACTKAWRALSPWQPYFFTPYSSQYVFVCCSILVFPQLKGALRGCPTWRLCLFLLPSPSSDSSLHLQHSYYSHVLFPPCLFDISGVLQLIYLDEQHQRASFQQPPLGWLQ